MEIQMYSRNLEITPRLQEYVEKKVSKLIRYLPYITEVRVDLAVENTRAANQRQVAQLTIRTPRVILRAEERAGDLFAAIDAALDKMRRQIRRYKTRRQDRWQRWAETEMEMGSEGEEIPVEEEAPVGKIVRVKRFEMVPMSPEEAIEQMELLGHQFFVFLNAEEGNINVLYRRDDGNYGLIVPETR
ncbi:MAG: ribosome-associated translation inhibitor RaiA [Anaerolineae bacterium]|nr:ribosome-associated translation inhibitor RaiA [Anaerolineae bacterium]MCX8067470.1 ribosome-associated translation inhibitor RaiA [Anaerolineae bacterium]